jgi:hypothetical protein
LLCLRFWRCILHDRSYEAIPSSRKRLNEDRCVCRFAQGVAQPLDGSIQALIEVDEGVGWPEFAAQFLSGDHLARPFKQGRQDLKRLFLELYLVPPVAKFPSVEIDLERTETNNS